MAEGDVLRMNAGGHQEIAALVSADLPAGAAFGTQGVHLADAATDLSTNVSVALLTDVPALVNATNTRVNALATLLNQVLDTLEAYGQRATS